MSRPLKRLPAKAGLVLAAILAALAVAELFLRLVTPVDLHAITDGPYQPSLNPNIAYELRPRTLDHNSDGLRGPEIPIPKPPGVRRVLVLGDSIAYGLKAGLEETFPRRLEKKLNAAFPSSRFQVINLGVPGYRLLQIVERFLEKGLKYSPDLVVYACCLNDAYDSLSPGEQLLVQNKDKVPFQSGPLQRTFFRWLLKTQIARRAVLLYRSTRYGDAMAEATPQNIRRLMKDLDPQTAAIYNDYLNNYFKKDYTQMDDAWRIGRSFASPVGFYRFNKELARLSGICRGRGIGCIFLLTPLLYDHRPGDYLLSDVHVLLKSLAAHYGFQVLEISGPLKSQQARTGVPEDVFHPDRAGHEIMARELFDFMILSQNLRALERGKVF